MDAQVHVIIDNGTGYMKGGFSGEDVPKCVFPTSLSITHVDEKIEKILIGEEGENEKEKNKNEVTEIKHPIENGIIEDWDHMQLIWEHIIKEKLNRSPEDHNVMLTNFPLNKKENREKMAEIMFENLKVPGLYISMTSVMSLYSSGKTVGIVVDSGESITNFVPVFEGYAFNDAISQNEIGGKSITKYLLSLIKDKINLNLSKKTQNINKIKENYCYVSYDFGKDTADIEEEKNEQVKISLPDGQGILLGVERYKCTEALFQPSLIDKQCRGIHEECNNSISKTEIEIRKDFYHNIVMAGGNTLFKGLPDRFSKEIQKLTLSASSNNVKIFALPDRKYASWIGASILSSLSNFQCLWITKAEYDEEKNSILHKRCI